MAHLFTYQDFEDGVIGLAYVGNPKRNAVGGICTESNFTISTHLFLPLLLLIFLLLSPRPVPPPPPCHPPPPPPCHPILTIHLAVNAFRLERFQTQKFAHFNDNNNNNNNTPFAVHYEKIRNHWRETATNSAKIHSLARKYEHLRINQIQ